MLKATVIKDTPTKDIIIHLLAKEHPLHIIPIKNYLKKRYGRNITYQGVRKIVKELLKEEIVEKENEGYQLRNEWVNSMRKFFTAMASSTISKQKKISNEETEVYEFEDLKSMMDFWYALVDDWLTHEKGQVKNYYQCAHAWEALLHLDNELQFIEKLKHRKIPINMLITSNTFLDRSILAFYRKHKITSAISNSHTTFDKSFYVGTYGKLIIQAIIDKELVAELENFFKISKALDSFALEKLQLIARKKSSIRMTVIRNSQIAEQINRSIIAEIEKTK